MLTMLHFYPGSQVLLQLNLSWVTTAMRDHLSWRTTNLRQKVLQFNANEHVIKDDLSWNHIFMSNGVVFHNRFHCNCCNSSKMNLVYTWDRIDQYCLTRIQGTYRALWPFCFTYEPKKALKCTKNIVAPHQQGLQIVAAKISDGEWGKQMIYEQVIFYSNATKICYQWRQPMTGLLIQSQTRTSPWCQ